METKICTKCKIEKDVTEFYNYKKSPDGKRRRCKKCMNIDSLEYNHKNKEKIDFIKQKYVNNNIEKVQLRKNEWSSNNRINQKNNPIFQLKVNLRSRLYIFFRTNNIKKINKTFDIVGCTPQELKLYIEKQFTEGMSWKNYGYYGWHVDHKIPLGSAKTEEEVYKLCYYDNLQPLWRHENMSKGSKII
jgi:hypothetical protein